MFSSLTNFFLFFWKASTSSHPQIVKWKIQACKREPKNQKKRSSTAHVNDYVTDDAHVSRLRGKMLSSSTVSLQPFHFLSPSLPYPAPTPHRRTGEPKLHFLSLLLVLLGFSAITGFPPNFLSLGGSMIVLSASVISILF